MIKKLISNSFILSAILIAVSTSSVYNTFGNTDMFSVMFVISGFMTVYGVYLLFKPPVVKLPAKDSKEVSNNEKK